MRALQQIAENGISQGASRHDKRQIESGRKEAVFYPAMSGQGEINSRRSALGLWRTEAGLGLLVAVV